ncbi:hypothetical protein HOY34_21775, partial [Xinfangfangia sp. D13-10-4-6]|uniref:hypothetical protein n=1 Tax=Pseudogemmobacter hezensis TaxID=2737662 RepID=UPI001C12D468
QATINSDGTWTVDVPNASFDGNPVEATITRGGETASDDTPVPVVPAAPALDVTIDDVTTPVDPATPGNTTLTGTVTDPTGTGTVMVTVGGTDYQATINSDGTWTVDVPNASFDGNPVEATVTRGGETASDDTTVPVVPATPALDVTIDDVTTPVDPATPGNTTLTGTVTDPTGTGTVMVTVGGTDYQATINSDGTWTVVVPNASFDGNPVEATITRGGETASDDTPVPVVPAAPALDVTIDDVTTPVDPATPGNTTLTGTVTDPTGTGTVMVTVGGTDYQAIINSDGTWTVDVPNASFDGNPVEATVTRGSETASDDTPVPVAPAAPALDVTIDDVTTPVDPATPGNTTLTGTVTDPTGTGTVTVTVGGTDYPATINSDGTWTVDVPNASFDGNPVEATVTRGGETASDDTPVPVVPAAPALDVTIDDVTTPVDPATPGNTTL